MLAVLSDGNAKLVLYGPERVITAGGGGSYALGCHSSSAPCRQAGRSCRCRPGAAVGAVGPGVWRPHGAWEAGDRRASQGSHHEPHRGGIETLWNGED